MEKKTKDRVKRRLRIIEGQIGGLGRAIEAEKYCIDILTQSLAIQRSLKSLDAVVLENHLKTHAKHQLRQKGAEHKAVSELIKIFKLSNK